MALVGFLPTNLCCGAGFKPTSPQKSCTRLGLLKDALPTELHPRCSLEKDLSKLQQGNLGLAALGCETNADKNQVLLQTSRRRRLPARSGVSFVLLVGPVAVLDADGSLLGLLEALVLAIRPVLVLDHGRCLPVQVLQGNKFIKFSCRTDNKNLAQRITFTA